jgi:hypothetical protein
MTLYARRLIVANMSLLKAQNSPVTLLVTEPSLPHQRKEAYTILALILDLLKNIPFH